MKDSLGMKLKSHIGPNCNTFRAACPKPFILMLLMSGWFVVAGCGKPPDQKAYEEVISSMSLAKAKDFFNGYPRSAFRERLINDLIDWCKTEKTAQCYSMILEALPEDHPKSKEVANFYLSISQTGMTRHP